MTITTPEAIEALCELLNTRALRSSEISRQMAEDKSLRQADNLERRTDLYMFTTPEQTLEWRASEALRTLSAENARLQEALEIMRAAFAGYCTSPMHNDAILIADSALQENK